MAGNIVLGNFVKRIPGPLDRVHKRLMNRKGAYAKWHEQRYHDVVHWALLIVIGVAGFAVINGALRSTGLLPSLASTQVKVLQWNAQYGEGTDHVTDRGRTAATIAKYNPDLVSLNEVTPEDAVDYRNRLTQITGTTWYSHFVTAQDDGTGNEILSRYPFVTTGVRSMQNNGQYARNVVQATVTIGGVPLTFFSTHLDHQDSSIRLAQIEELKQYVTGFSGAKIIAGDFNANAGSAEYSSVLASYQDSWQAALNSGTAASYVDNPPNATTRTRKSRLDWILFAGANLAVRSAQIPDLRDFSNANVTFPLDPYGCPNYATRDYHYPEDCFVRPSDHNLQLTTFELAGTTSTPPPPPPNPPPPPSSSAPEIVLYGSDVPSAALRGAWSRVADSAAAGGAKLKNRNDGDAKIAPALANPADYFEATFTAEAGVAYHVWLRMEAQDNFYGNDSVHVQFSDSTDLQGNAAYRIGTASSLEVVLEEGVDAGVAGWGWNDNNWGTLGANIKFATTGAKTVRVQQREDGVSIDQIVISPAKYLSARPGATKNDATIVSK